MTEAQVYQKYIEVIAYHDDRQFDQNPFNDAPEEQIAGRIHEGTEQLKAEGIKQYLSSLVGMNVLAYLPTFQSFSCDQLQFRAVIEQDGERLDSLMVGTIVMQAY